MRVAGTVYLHLVSAIDHAAKRVQISNNRGRINGWTSHDRVFGLCVAVDDVPRPGTDGKTVAAGDQGQQAAIEPCRGAPARLVAPIGPGLGARAWPVIADQIAATVRRLGN